MEMGTFSGKIRTEAPVRYRESIMPKTKTRLFGLHFCRRHYGSTVLLAFLKLASQATASGEMRQNNGHYVVQSLSRSPLLVPIKSPYAMCE